MTSEAESTITTYSSTHCYLIRSFFTQGPEHASLIPNTLGPGPVTLSATVLDPQCRIIVLDLIPVS